MVAAVQRGRVVSSLVGIALEINFIVVVYSMKELGIFLLKR